MSLSETQLENLRKSIIETNNFDYLNVTYLKLYDFKKTMKVKEGPMAFQALTFSENEFGLFFSGLAIQIDISPTPRFKSGSEYLHVGIADVTDLGYPFNGFPNFSVFSRLGSGESNIERLKNFVLKIDDDDLCPCGHSWTKSKKLLHRKKFRECCKVMWFTGLLPPAWYGFQSKLPPKYTDH